MCSSYEHVRCGAKWRNMFAVPRSRSSSLVSNSLCLLRTFLHSLLCFLVAFLLNINSRNIKIFVRKGGQRNNKTSSNKHLPLSLCLSGIVGQECLVKRNFILFLFLNFINFWKTFDKISEQPPKPHRLHQRVFVLFLFSVITPKRKSSPSHHHLSSASRLALAASTKSLQIDMEEELAVKEA